MDNSILLLINILALSSALYVIQVFNKYLTYKLETTLIVLTVGVLIAFFLEFLLRIVRSLLVNKLSVVGKRDIVLKNVDQAFNLKLGVLNSKTENNFFDRLRPNSINHNIDEGEKLILVIDIFFVFIFICVIFLLSIHLGIISSIFIITYLLFIKLKKYALQDMIAKKNEFLINTNKSFYQIKNLASSVRILIVKQFYTHFQITIRETKKGRD